MSIEALVNKDVKVSDFEELKPRAMSVWDKVKNYGFGELEYIQEDLTPFVLECQMRSEEIYKLIPQFIESSNKKITINLIESIGNSKKISINSFLSNYKLIRLLQKDTSYDNPRGLNEANKYINKVILSKDGYSNLKSNLSFMFDYKVNFPSIDIANIMNKIISNETEYVNECIESNIIPFFGGDRLELMAHIKILYPEYFKNIDLKSTPLYKSAESLANKWIDEGKVDKDSIFFAANLKVLASEKTFIGKNGLEIIMPADLKSDVILLPDRRKF